jgi:hypothetical protein
MRAIDIADGEDFAETPEPMPPQPIDATPGRSLAEGGLAGAPASAARASSRPTNHSGRPLAAVAIVRRMNERRDIWMD